MQVSIAKEYNAIGREVQESVSSHEVGAAGPSSSAASHQTFVKTAVKQVAAAEA